jgi:asparagine synthase (glutamine-hydrolysing)
MCGIAGIFTPDRAIDPDDLQVLKAMLAAQAARGPDGEGVFYDERLALGHRRLAIIDLSPAGAQPMGNEDGSIQVACNGEIYNYKKLRQELIEKGHIFRSQSDSEVLLHGYEEWGMEGLLGRLRGMFAFALYDSGKSKPGSGGRGPRLFLARDPFGIKPLYYAVEGSCVYFASQVKALLAGGRIDRTTEPAGVVGFYVWGHLPDPFTLYRKIKAISAGSYIGIDCQGSGKEIRYFDLTRELSSPSGPRPGSQKEAQEMLASTLRDSVRHHLVADVPVGVFLSSGIDSGTMTALASEEAATKISTFTLGFEEFKGAIHDEVPLAEKLARRYGTEHQTRWVRREDFSGELSRILAAMDQPSIDGVNTYFVAKCAKEAGMKVALSGLGGDELFGGYPGFYQIPKFVRFSRPLSCVPGFGKAFRLISSPLAKRLTSPKYAGIFEYGGDFAGAYFLRRALFMPWELAEFLPAELVREGWERLNTLTSLKATIGDIDSDRMKIAALETYWYMKNQLLRDTDWASMAHSLEVRVPIVDVQVYKMVSLLNASGYQQGKKEFGCCPSGRLPDEILNKPKTGFAVPVREWLLSHSDDHQQQFMYRGLRGWSWVVGKSFNLIL